MPYCGQKSTSPLQTPLIREECWICIRLGSCTSVLGLEMIKENVFMQGLYCREYLRKNAPPIVN